MRELEAGAREKLRCEQAAPEWRTGAKGEPMPAEDLRSLHNYLQTIPDFRKKRGQRCDIACYMTIIIAARLSGYRGIAAFGEYAARLDEEQLRAFGGFRSPSRRRFTARQPRPSTTFCPPCRRTRWRRLCASGSSSSSRPARRSPSTARTCAEHRGRSRANGG